MTYVFDLDGTLINSKKRHWYLMKKILISQNFMVDITFSDGYLKYKQDGFSGESYLINKMNIDLTLAKEIQSEWVQHIEDEALLQTDCLYDDALITLNKIKGDILLCTIRSNKKGLLRELKCLGLDMYPLKVISIAEKKSEIIKKINDECIMIGDTEIDYQAAIEAGCSYYILNRGFRSKKYWDSRNVPSYSDLSELVI